MVNIISYRNLDEYEINYIINFNNENIKNYVNINSKPILSYNYGLRERLLCEMIHDDFNAIETLKNKIKLETLIIIMYDINICINYGYEMEHLIIDNE